VAKLFATLDAGKAHPESAASGSGNQRWISGTHNRNEISTILTALNDEQPDPSTSPSRRTTPRLLGGGDAAPTPAELLLAAMDVVPDLGLGNIAAVARSTGIGVESSLGWRAT